MGAGHKIEPVVHESNEKVIFSNKVRIRLVISMRLDPQKNRKFCN